ncbi:MAG TPA: hypothetical protein VGA03_05570, partial [Anaerolineales bacterium]
AWLGRKYVANDDAWRAVHTTYARLVSHPSPPFMLQTVAGLRLPASKVEFLEQGLNLSERTLTLDHSLLEDLDYWEVDPAWDGKIFRSASQAVRPRKNETIPAHLNLPSRPGSGQEGGERPVGVRLVKINGERVFLTLRIGRT